MLGLRSNLFGRIISSNVRQEPFKKFTPFLFNVQPKNVITFTSPNQPIFSRFASHKKERQKEEKRQLRERERERLAKERVKERAEKEKKMKRLEEEAAQGDVTAKTPAKTEEIEVVFGEKLSKTVKRRQAKKRQPIEPGAILQDRTYRGLDVLDQNSNVPRITHSELRTLLQSNSGNVVIIDLRDKALPGEPRIPGSQVVPVARITDDSTPQLPSDTFTFSEDLFKKRFNFEKPKQEDTIIVVSAYGRRSDLMTEALVSNGFTNAKSLYGGVILYNKYYNPKQE